MITSQEWQRRVFEDGERICYHCGSADVPVIGDDWCSTCDACEKSLADQQAARRTERKQRAADRHGPIRTSAENGLRNAAGAFVAAAVRHGFLARLDGSQSCVDCGAVATCYEHRDYARPLDVEPACQSCNIRRGRGRMPPQVVAA